MGVVFDLELLDDPHRADTADPPDIVAREVEQHKMFGEFLGIGQEFPGKDTILRRILPAPPRPGEGSYRDLLVAHSHQNLRTRPDDGEIAEIQEEQERRRIEDAQRAIERERRQLEVEREEPRRPGMEDNARLAEPPP